MTPTDSICEVKTTISTKEAETKAKRLCKKVFTSDGTNTVLRLAFLSTLISQHCFLRIRGEAKYILMNRKTATSWKTNKILDGAFSLLQFAATYMSGYL